MRNIVLPSSKKFLILFISFFTMSDFLTAQAPKGDPTLTEFYSPVPKIVTPGKTDAQPPSDAIILFDGKNLDLWRAEGPDTAKAAGWKVHDDIVTVDKKAKGIYRLSTSC